MTVAFVVAVAAVTPAVAADAAAASPVQCGAVVTADAHLTHDLSCPSGVGLTLDGNVTLDLGGHRLIGPGKSSAAFPVSIAVALTASGTPRVRNGTIQGWGTGTGPSVDNDGRSDVGIERVTYSDNSWGVFGFNSAYDVSDSRFTRNSDSAIGGLYVHVTVRGSSFLDNGEAVGIGGGGAITLDRSILERNGTAVECSEVSCTITRSALRDNVTAISAFFSGGKLTGDDISGNEVGFTTGFDPDPGYAHELSRNLFRDNGTAVIVDSFGTAFVHDNIFKRNGVGFTMVSADDNTFALLERNLFTRNDDGVFITHAGTRLGYNTAIHNRGWGIYAIGAVDLGGNVARGNGRSPQCVGVTCTSHR